MLANALFATTVVFIALGFYLLDQCRFLIPYRDLLIHRHGRTIGLFALVLFGNLLAGFFALGRRFFLKDTGSKLAHLEKQLAAARASRKSCRAGSPGTNDSRTRREPRRRGAGRWQGPSRARRIRAPLPHEVGQDPEAARAGPEGCCPRLRAQEASLLAACQGQGEATATRGVPEAPG